jgi:diphosphomevalonate decarboxylase
MVSTIAIAHPNIAFIKYWGNRDETLRIPLNGSISMNLDGLETQTSVDFSVSSNSDSLTINEKPVSGPGLKRVSLFLDLVRQMSGKKEFARVVSRNNFPTGTGIASSAAAFAALALAACKAAGLELSESALSRLARRGSGSACRSVPGGFVEWQAGTEEADSYAVSIASPGDWELMDCIVVLSSEHKVIGSTEGHALAGTSPLQSARVADAPRRLEICRTAILQRDFAALADIVELDSNMLHAVMLTSRPALMYWQAASITVMQAIHAARGKGLPVCYTLDAGPNVHVITEKAHTQRVSELLQSLPGVKDIRVAGAGGPARLLSE